jgi:hypothetical protein
VTGFSESADRADLAAVAFVVAAFLELDLAAGRFTERALELTGMKKPQTNND